MGTTYSVVLIAASHSKAEPLHREVDKILEEVNSSLSTYRHDSLITAWNKSTSGLKIDKNFETVLMTSKKIYEISDGRFNPLVGELVDLWGFGPSGRKQTPPGPKIILDRKKVLQWDEVLDFSAKTKRLEKKQKAYLDFSAIAKGMAVDQVSLYLKKKGFKNHLVEIGGEVRALGKNLETRPWRIGLQAPVGRELSKVKVFKVVGLRPPFLAMASSGNYRNYWKDKTERFSHTLNPNTGRPMKGKLEAVSVLAGNCMLADGIATALMASGLEKGLVMAKRYKISAFFWVKTDRGYRPHFTGEFLRFIEK